MAFRLKSPLHIGWRKVGNLQQTRKYVTGKVFWAALTARLTRDLGKVKERNYAEMGEKINESFRFGYFYPALPDSCQNLTNLRECFPWNTRNFDYLFLDSYASTAVSRIDRSDEGTLHETEFISPVSRNGDPVYLVGSVWTGDPLDEELRSWRDSLNCLRLGGERGYGWGQIEVCIDPVVVEKRNEIKIIINEGNPVLAHVDASNIKDELTGTVEPLVGWERDVGGSWRLTRNVNLAYVPGSIATCTLSFTADHFGIWKRIE
ncbi:MAG: hypothetical protein WBA22_01570 [Candidatus Methanofastidiosia archaeon]